MSITNSSEPTPETTWSVLLQLAVAIIPALSMAYHATVVLPEMRAVEISIRNERAELDRRVEENKAARSRAATEQALLLVDLEQSRKLAKTINTLLKQGD